MSLFGMLRQFKRMWIVATIPPLQHYSGTMQKKKKRWRKWYFVNGKGGTRDDSSMPNLKDILDKPSSVR